MTHVQLSKLWLHSLIPRPPPFNPISSWSVEGVLGMRLCYINTVSVGYISMYQMNKVSCMIIWESPDGLQLPKLVNFCSVVKFPFWLIFLALANQRNLSMPKTYSFVQERQEQHCVQESTISTKTSEMPPLELSLSLRASFFPRLPHSGSEHLNYAGVESLVVLSHVTMT